MPILLFWYRCPHDSTLASTPVKVAYGSPLRCNLCHSFMRYLYGVPVDTPELQALVRRGLVYNPTVEASSHEV